MFCAGNASMPQVTVVEGSDALLLGGLQLDSVKTVIPIRSILMESDGTFALTETTLRKTSATLTTVEAYPFTGEAFWKVFFRTMTADRTALSARIDDEYRAKFLTRFSNWKLGDGHSPNQQLPSDLWAEISSSVNTIVEDKEMFLTEQGYLGLGQEGVREGDIVCVFCGGDVPFLLRKSEKTPGILHLLSECYVHGIMDGEAMKGLDKNQITSFFIK
jgi:hypothetical protein